MRTTTKYGFQIPSLNTDNDDIPTQLGIFADEIDAAITRFSNGSYAAMPAPGILNQYYLVDSGTTNYGGLYRDNGSAWQLVNVLAGVVGDITTMGFGDAPTTGVSGRYAPSDHRHGSQANPVIAHVAASNPHTQYLLAALAITNFTVPFHIAGALTAGVKKPKWIATKTCIIRSAYAVCDVGSGATYQLYKNGASATASSPTVGTSPSAYGFSQFNMAPGDYLQVDVAAIGTSVTDFSITVDGVWTSS